MRTPEPRRLCALAGSQGRAALRGARLILPLFLLPTHQEDRLMRSGSELTVLALVVIVAGSVPAVGAPGNSPQCKAGTGRDDGEFVGPNGTVYVSERAFIERGLRCGTKELDEETQARIEQ